VLITLWTCVWEVFGSNPIPNAYSKTGLGEYFVGLGNDSSQILHFFVIYGAAERYVDNRHRRKIEHEKCRKEISHAARCLVGGGGMTARCAKPRCADLPEEK
jgi:hypothetical protein